MSLPLPCLIFSSDGNLCDEQNALSSLRGAFNLSILQDAFDSALGSELRSFRDFCSEPIRNLRDFGHRLFRLKGLSEYTYAFCEKNTILHSEYITVFLGRDLSEFSRFMSLTSCYSKSSVYSVLRELLYLRSRRVPENLTSITPEALIALSRTPNLSKAMLERFRNTRCCDICAVTEHIVSQFRTGPMRDIATVRFSMNEPLYNTSSNAVFFDLPLEAYVSLLLLCMIAEEKLSSDHSIDLILNCFGGAAVVTVTTRTDIHSDSVDHRPLAELRSLCPFADDLLEALSLISLMSDMDVSYDYSLSGRQLTLNVTVGGEISPLPDFKYSDPSEDISSLADEFFELVCKTEQ